jgi:hypothetical protein
LCPSGLIADNSNEQVRDAGSAHITQFGEPLPIDTIEKHQRATQRLAFMHRLEHAR